jgi:hypothetical protein
MMAGRRVAHYELRFHLLHRIHGYADHNQQGGSAEIEGQFHTFQHEPPHVLVKPGPHQRQVL